MFLHAFFVCFNDFLRVSSEIKGDTGIIIDKNYNKGVLKLSVKQQLTNQQMSASGLNRKDNGEIDHIAEKKAKSKKNDNVKPKA